MMRKGFISTLTIVFMTAILLPLLSVKVQAADNNYCVMLRFVNNTRFKRLAPEVKLSDLVMEKLVASGKLRLKETRPIDETIDTELYSADYRAEQAVSQAEKGNFDALFDNRQASSIAEAHTGQKISPEITARIGEAHGADYLIQGTILGIARGSTEDNNASFWTAMAGMATGKWGGSVGDKVGAVLRDTKMTYSGTNIQCDLRVIRAGTGEVVWHKMVTAVSEQKKLKVGELASVGTDKISMNLYEMALDQAAQKIADTLITDVESGRLADL